MFDVFGSSVSKYNRICKVEKINLTGMLTIVRNMYMKYGKLHIVLQLWLMGGFQCLNT
jgi:hypothetical protein